MDYKEYLEKRKALKEQMELLDKEFISNNNYKPFEGKKVLLQSVKEPVIYEGVIKTSWGLEKAYRKINKNGSLRANINTAHIASNITKVFD